MKSFWSGMTERERLLISTGAVVVAALLIYMLGVNPLVQKQHSSLRALEAEKAIYNNVIDMAQASKTNNDTSLSAPYKTMAIREAVTEASRKTGIAISRIQPGRDGDVTFWIDVANTEEIFNWLLLLKKDYGRQATQVSLQKNVGEETLRGQFEFEGAGQ